ncbi:hypothetical protein MBAV_003988 [Candidatus Magnetobacterium bavaricum]|uniref:Uncharacterized protein n=1 Tax=Candidatus Magnetobacterium bavaricum TaxID=29290 RepID=A0A0F3GT35_9BACT|nr:hypothetical protein MBAV_003988 [Candidatus Magnetobacterium bavaricum]
MATIDLTGGTSAIPHNGIDKQYRIKNRLDFSANNATASDTINIVKIKANTHVTKVYTKIVTPEGAVATCTIGDSADTDGFDASVNLNAAAGAITQSTASDAYADGKIYTTETSIDLTPANNLSTAVIDVYVTCEDLN